MVEPDANIPGSTSVACWLSGLVNLSVLNCVSEICCVGGGEGAGEPGSDDMLPLPHASMQERADTASAQRKHVLAMSLLRAAVMFLYLAVARDLG